MNSIERVSHPSQTQLEVLVQLLEANPALAKGFLRNSCAKAKAAKEWETITISLNSIGGGAIKTAKKWMKESVPVLPESPILMTRTNQPSTLYYHPPRTLATYVMASSFVLLCDDLITIYRLSENLIPDLENEIKHLVTIPRRKGKSLTTRCKRQSQTPIVNMTHKPENHVSTTGNIQNLDGERVVISGMSGIFPRSRSVKELSDILYNKINPIEHTSRFIYHHPEVAQYAGTVPGLTYFDAQFFKVHYRLANCMDPMGRKVLEHAYQAIYDAGINPEDLSGKKVGVYIGSCLSETEKACFYEATSRTGFGIAGCSKTMFANRISYWLNAKGPSMSIDEACCSSTAALEQAYLAINRGECEAAIVGGAYISLHPQSSVHYGRMMKLSSDGKTKSFDKHADGCVKSETINVLFLQKAANALRIYADVLYAKTEFTCVIPTQTGPKFGFSRNINSYVDFIKKFYHDAKVPPEAVEYVEAFGSAIPEADKTELEVIAKVLCESRNNTLLIGSVTSNIGYAEAASGISAVIKVLLGYHYGKLAANLHYEEPRDDILALRDGQIRIVNEHQSFNCTYAAVNGMAVTGTNSHVLLHGYRKTKDPKRYKSSIPHLVNISGRHEEAVKYVFDILKSNPIDQEQLALIHNIHRTSISGHMGRGFIILNTDKEQKTVSLFEKSEYFDNMNRPLWFVYSGMGSQWAGMGTALLRIPIFAAAIERCRKALQPKGLDIVEIITTLDENIFNNILHSFVGIAAIQIGLTDILHAIGLKPHGIIGHSVGELGCAYADGCLTADEMILAAYYRGLVSLETKLIYGSMAAVGMGYDQISKLCPPEIEVACHNGPDSSTISGPADVMRKFVAELTEKHIFAREVPCSNIAYHSRYIADAGPGLLKYLKKVITDPKPRSKLWFSSSVPEGKWSEPFAKSCSADYLTNNLLSPVLFDETSRLIPKNAVLVEIAPHGLLQAILKRSMPESCINIPLTRRKHSDNVVLLLQAIGKLYMKGYNTNLQALYPKVEMPVSTGTPFLSHFVTWAHGENWPLAVYRNADRKFTTICIFVVSLHDKEQSYLQGHSVRGKILYPFSASLMLAWDTLAMIKGVQKKQLSVTFTDLHFHAEPILHNRRQLKLHVSINIGNGWFEILDGNSKVMTGFIKVADSVKKSENDEEINSNMGLTSEDVYKLLADRDYSYSGQFQSISGVDESLNEALITWQENWVTFLDGILQFNMLRQTHDAVSLPTRIGSIIVDVKKHSNFICNSNSLNNKVLIPAKILEQSNNTRCGGILIENIIYQNLPKVTNNMILKTLRFISNHEDDLTISSSLEIYMQIVAENVNKDMINVIGMPNNNKEGYMFKEINHVIKNIFDLKVSYKELNRETDLTGYNFDNIDLILVQDLSWNDSVYQKFQQVLRKDQFIVSEDNLKRISPLTPDSRYKVISAHSFEQYELRLIRWKLSKPFTGTTTISLRSTADFDFVKSVHANLAPDHRLLIISPHPVPCGVKEFVSSLRQEAKRDTLHMIAVNYDDVNYFEEKLSDMELAYNVLYQGELGGEYYLPLEEKAKVANMRLQNVAFGGYDSLHWVEAPTPILPGINIKVQYAGISAHDIKKASGLLLSKHEIEYSYGLDFSGITESGERVMGIVTGGALSTQIRAQPELLWPVPAHWSLEEAATVPLAYMQAFYCLGIKAPIHRGYSVLVHGGAGALGQAVINILLANECEVFTTVSDIHKKNFLLKLFPSLKADHVGYSRDDTFASMILSTKKPGCDIVISCVKGNLKNLGMNCLTFGGIYCDILQVEDQEDYKFGIGHLNHEKNYVCVDFSAILDVNRNMKDVMLLSKMLSNGITSGSIRPLSRVTYEPSEVSRAFRLLGSSQHRGRVLLSMNANNVPERNRLFFKADNCHLILGDSVKFAVEFANMLVSRGVKKICMYAETPSPYLQHKIRLWRHSNVDVIIFSEKFNELKDIYGLLNKVLRLGNLEGVYVTALQDNKNMSNVINDLDSASRVLCPKLRYFTVLNVGDHSVGKDVCVRRVSDKLPANVLLLPEFKNVLNNESAKWRGAVDVAERALQSSYTVLLAHSEQESEPTILQRIATLAGITIADDADKSLTLHELGIDDLEEHQYKVICSALQLHYNLAFDKEQISNMPLEMIQQLYNSIIELPYEDSKGLGTFFNYVDPDEMLATTEIVLLPTLVSSASMRGDEFDPNQKYLYIIPGMEGHHERFRVLCERLKLPAAVLQPGFDNQNETLDETAKRYSQVLLKKHEIKDNFYLLGYESGIYIALKLAAILEENGLKGKVYCLGLSPSDLQQEIDLQLAEYKTEEQLFDAVVKHMFTLMVGSDKAKLDVELSKISSRSEKIDVSVRALLGRVSHSAQYARDLIETALSRIQQVRRFNPSPVMLRSQVIFLRAQTTTVTSMTLQQYSEQPIIVHSLQAPLAECAADLRCANIINEHFDTKILEDFSKRNICDSYILNPDSFMCVVYDQE